MGKFRLEIVTERAGLEPFIWKFLPGLVPTAHSESFVIYAVSGDEPLGSELTSLLENWREEHILVAYSFSENDRPAVTSHVTPVEAYEISGYSDAYWRKKAWQQAIPGAMKPGKQWLLPRSYVEAHPKKKNIKATR